VPAGQLRRECAGAVLMPADTTTLERELDALLTVERFAPPAEFAER
jgi:hypothetical protein